MADNNLNMALKKWVKSMFKEEFRVQGGFITETERIIHKLVTERFQARKKKQFEKRQ